MNNLKTHFIKNHTNVIKRNLRICFFILNFFVLINRANAQQYVQKSFGNINTNEYASTFINFNSNSSYFLGRLNDTLNHSNILLLKTDSIPLLQWSKIYGDSSSNYGTQLVKTSDSSMILICGKTNNTTGIVSTTTLIRVNLSGDTLWTKNYFFQNESR